MCRRYSCLIPRIARWIRIQQSRRLIIRLRACGPRQRNICSLLLLIRILTNVQLKNTRIEMRVLKSLKKSF